MPPVGKGRKKAKGDASDVASEVVTDDLMGPPPPQTRLRHTESELESSSSEMDVVLANLGSKRYKSDGAAAAAAAAAATASAAPAAAAKDVAVSDGPESLATVVAAASAAVPPGSVPSSTYREGRIRRRTAAITAPNAAAASGPCVTVADMRKVTDGFYDVVFGAGLEADTTRRIVDCAGKYEELLMKLLVENERLRGRLDVYQSPGFGQMAPSSRHPAPVAPARGVAVASAAASSVVVPAVPVPAVPAPKPVETWSVVVRGKGGAATSKEVVSKVVGQVGPTLGVRVHELKEIRRGGAVIRTPSLAERERIAANKKFAEVGLEVSVNDKLGPRVVVRGVHPEISPDDFMNELYEMNLKEKMPQEIFKKSVRLVSSPWKPGTGAQNIVLEGGEKVMNQLLDVGRVYIKWFSFMVKPQNEVPHCFKCLGFDHRRRECRMKDSVCRICSQGGHESWQCQGQPWCRNCALKGLPADHSMMASVCPTYAALVARANARH